MIRFARNEILSLCIIACLVFVCAGRSDAQPDDQVAMVKKVGIEVFKMARSYHNDFPVFTDVVKIRPEGDVIHGYSRIRWTSKYRKKQYISEVHWSMSNRPGKRRFITLLYDDNHWSPFRFEHHNPAFLAKLNRELFKSELIDNAAEILFAPTHWTYKSKSPTILK